MNGIEYSVIQWSLMGVAAAIFFIGVAFLGIRVSKRESVSFLMLLLGLRRGVEYTPSEKIILIFVFLIPLAVVAFAIIIG